MFGIRPKIIGTFMAVVLVMAGLATFAVLRLVSLSQGLDQTVQMVSKSEKPSHLQVTAKEMQGLTYLYAQQPTDQTLAQIGRRINRCSRPSPPPRTMPAVPRETWERCSSRSKRGRPFITGLERLIPLIDQYRRLVDLDMDRSARFRRRQPDLPSHKPGPGRQGGIQRLGRKDPRHFHSQPERRHTALDIPSGGSRPSRRASRSRQPSRC